MKIPFQELHSFLDDKYRTYNRSAFIESDPISIPHQFKKKEDIEIAGFLTATIAWGRRDVIIRNSARMMKMMGDNPHEFTLNSGSKMTGFKHRTFNENDLTYFIRSLKNIYLNFNGLEGLFTNLLNDNNGDVQAAISGFKKVFFSLPHEQRITKHISDPMKGSSAKRINMYLRWMVRNDKQGVDFGIWTKISPSILYMPLDVHTGRVARKLGLLRRKQNDWKAVAELTESLRKFDPEDPVKYDFALFGLGIEEKF